MLQGQQQLNYRSNSDQVKPSSSLQRYPILAPILFLLGSVALGITSLFSDTLFPVLAFIGLPTATFFLSIACILGIVGVLVGIINMLEHVDRTALQATAISQRKEHGYANQN